MDGSSQDDAEGRAERHAGGRAGQGAGGGAAEDFAEAHDRLCRIYDKRMLFIVGATRWGTAWVQNCLDAHPNVLAKGEGHFSDMLFPLLAKAFDSYNTEAEKIGNRMQLAGLPGNAAGFTFDDVDHLLATAVGLIYSRWCRDDDAITCIAEKTPEHVLALDLLDRMFPNMVVVHVIRDGRDEAVSAWDFNIGISRGEFPRKYPTFAAFAETFARNWSRSVGAARRFGRNNRLRYYQIRCEDLLTEPAPIIRRLFRFAQVDDSNTIVRETMTEAWRMVPLDLDPGVWKDTFDKDARRAFQRQSGELLKLLEYES